MSTPLFNRTNQKKMIKKSISLNKFQFCTHSQKCYECNELYTTSTKVNSIVVKRETKKHVAKRQSKYKKSMHNEDS